MEWNSRWHKSFEWHYWYAWHPILLGKKYVWLESIKRRRIEDGYDAVWEYER